MFLAMWIFALCYQNENPPPNPQYYPLEGTPLPKGNPLWASATTVMADFNNDSWLDIAVANGNDQRKEPVVVYTNDGKGGFSNDRRWISDDLDYNFGIGAGDFNKDGFIDLAVTTIISDDGPASSSDKPPGKGQLKVYYNRGGQFDPKPGYHSKTTFYGLNCRIMDANSDGYLDICVTSAVLNPAKPSVMIFFGDPNQNGEPAQTPGWELAAATVGDAAPNYFHEGAGIDLVLGGKATQLLASQRAKMGTTLSKRPIGQSKDEHVRVYALSAGYHPSEKRVLCVASFNNFCHLKTPLGINTCDIPSYFVAFQPTAGKYREIWRSASSGMGAGISLAHVRNDQNVDIIGTRMGNKNLNPMPLEIYFEDETGFATDPSFSSSTQRVWIGVAVGDLNRKGIRTQTVTFDNPGLFQHALVLPNTPIQELLCIKAGGVALEPGDYAWVPGASWITLKDPVQMDKPIVVTYSYSLSPDIFATTFYQPNNFLFYHTNPTP